ncbi:hypothetical protein, partial [Gordonia sihwensis]|uniref:hypothetical protein n=1 Tax=Gordonia sihwensis TaxID=173559 RepID=UPI001C930470
MSERSESKPQTGSLDTATLKQLPSDPPGSLSERSESKPHTGGLDTATLKQLPSDPPGPLSERSESKLQTGSLDTACSLRSQAYSTTLKQTTERPSKSRYGLLDEPDEFSRRR